MTPAGEPTGPARQITNEVADQLSWSGDSQHILYDSAGTMRMVSIDGGAPITVPIDAGLAAAARSERRER